MTVRWMEHLYQERLPKMKTKYIVTNGKLSLATDSGWLQYALRLDLIDESICISRIRDGLEAPGCAIVDTENGMIYWAIPQLSASDANALLNNVAPFVNLIISQYRGVTDYAEDPYLTSAQIAMNLISQHIRNLEFSASLYVLRTKNGALYPECGGKFSG